MKSLNELRRILLSGFLLILPLWVTLALSLFIVKKLSAVASPWISHIFNRIDIVLPAPVLYILSLAAALTVIFLVGLLGRKTAGRAIVRTLDRLFLRIPMLKTIYSSTQQIVQAFSGSQTRTLQKVVMVEYPRRGIRTLAFVTNRIGPYLSLFIPTTPNPTSGWLALMPEQQCEEVDLTRDEALKLIISGGIIVPDHFHNIHEKEEDDLS